MKRDTEAMYATMSPWRLFFVVALPGMVSMFAMSVYSIIEGAFIGQRLGEGAFAAVNIAMPLVMINFSLADLIGVGADFDRPWKKGASNCQQRLFLLGGDDLFNVGSDGNCHVLGGRAALSDDGGG